MKTATLLTLTALLAACAPNPPMKQGNVSAYDYTVFYVGLPERDPAVCLTKRARIVGGVVRFEC